MLPPRQSQAVMPYLPRLYDSPPDVHRRVLHELRWLDDLSDMSDEARVALRFPVDVLKHETHDQSAHGNWAHGSTVGWDRDATADGRTLAPSATGQLKATTHIDEAEDAKAHVAEVIAKRMSLKMSDADWQDYLDSKHKDNRLLYSGSPSMRDAYVAWHGIPEGAFIDGKTNTILTGSGDLFLADSTYHPDPDARQAKPGSAEAKELVKEYLVSNVVKSWARSSTGTLDSVLLQRAVQSSFGLDDARPVNRFEDKSPHKFHYEMARAMYRETQNTLFKAGVDAVDLWRGTSNRSRFIPVSWDEGDESYSGPPVAVRSKLSPLSSWSSVGRTANEFAGGDGVISRMVVPRERIFATPWSGVGCMDEAEFVVLGGEYDVMAGTIDSSWENV